MPPRGRTKERGEGIRSRPKDETHSSCSSRQIQDRSKVPPLRFGQESPSLVDVLRSDSRTDLF